MQRRKKQLLGLVGLMLVAAMAVIASILPVPQASAADRAGVGLKVQVGQPTLYIRINRVDGEAPAEDAVGQTVVRKELKVVVEYAYAKTVKVNLIDKGAVSIGSAPIMPLAETDSEGVLIEPTVNGCASIEQKSTVDYCEVTFQLDDVDHQFQIVALANDDDSAMDDKYLIVYRSASLQYKGENDANGDPVVYATLNDKVKLAMVQVYGADNKPVFMDGDQEQPLVLSLSDLENGVYIQRLTLKLKEAGMPAGTYTAVLVAYDTDDREVITANPEGHLIAVSTATNIKFTPNVPSGPGSDDPNQPGDPNDPNNPDTPDVPSTGRGLFSNLNISRADYIMTGVIAFGMVTIFAVVLIARRNRR